MYNKIDLCNVPTQNLINIDLDCVNMEVPAPEFEPQRQYYFMAKCRQYVKEMSEKKGRSLTFHTQTFGCPSV